ncbi:MAG: general secretion pathway protein GspK [Acidobacteria bacterium]|nr:general secretion pathway protein GspK [Acidobacteriota bacterium]
MAINRSRGGALLAVLWLSAALSAIAFSVATTVRGELERSATAADGTQGYFVARGAIQRALLYVSWGEQYRNPDGSARYWQHGMRRLHFEFPNGSADVDFIPESSKLNVNTAKPEELFRLLALLGAGPEQAQEITAAIVDWRSPSAGQMTAFDQYYLSLNPSFRARHASLEEIEELLAMRGVTPEMFHGKFLRGGEDRLIAQPGLRDCLSVYSDGGRVEANSAPEAVMAAIGIPPDGIAAIVAQRRMALFPNQEVLQRFTQPMGPVASRLFVGEGSITTLRATARVRLQNGQLSDMKRTVSALVKFAPVTKDAPYHILRWYDQGGLGVSDIQ